MKIAFYAFLFILLAAGFASEAEYSDAIEKPRQGLGGRVEKFFVPVLRVRSGYGTQALHERSAQSDARDGW
ncbi:MAG TPA: hypothetical protein VGC97_02235 [Pyrinomonadaceae bacterium]|jgi:hypothetical protein